MDLYVLFDNFQAVLTELDYVLIVVNILHNILKYVSPISAALLDRQACTYIECPRSADSFLVKTSENFSCIRDNRKA